MAVYQVGWPALAPQKVLFRHRGACASASAKPNFGRLVALCCLFLRVASQHAYFQRLINHVHLLPKIKQGHGEAMNNSANKRLTGKRVPHSLHGEIHKKGRNPFFIHFITVETLGLEKYPFYQLPAYFNPFRR